jgi:hypothetical protein
MNVAIHAKHLFINLSSGGFHRWARHYYKCKQVFQSPDPFSPVPYFLLCRAMELEIKSRHLQRKTRSEVKNEYWHDMVKAYEELDQEQKKGLPPKSLVS